MQKNCLGYPVEVVEDAFGESPVLAGLLREVTGTERPRILLVADLNVVNRTEGLGTRIGAYLQRHALSLAAEPVVFAGGEKVKADNLQSALGVVSAILNAKLGKGDCVVALGGGSILDVAGYAAAQARGGVGLVRLPTTVAAMTGAAFADAAAVDSATVKDALRVPSRPLAAVVDPMFARTVLDGVWRGGIGEAVRQAAVSDATLMKKLVAAAEGYFHRDFEALRTVVGATVASVMKKGLSTCGEWSAARLESMSGYKLPHGYALSIGVCVDAEYAFLKGMLKEKDRDAIRALLAGCGALDGLVHSRHLLSQPEKVLFGLDAWRLARGAEEIVVPVGIGKSEVVAAPDREAMAAAMRAVASLPIAKTAAI